MQDFEHEKLQNVYISITVEVPRGYRIEVSITSSDYTSLEQ